MSAQSNIRIIGGKWRSRKVSFVAKEGLRPTPDRIRETLFNWLSPYIVNAECLDLYAGSGVLSFEALSRGAKSAIALERNRDSFDQIEKNKQNLAAEQLQVFNADAIDWLGKNKITADIAFVDPPYKAGLLKQTLALLEENNLLKKNSMIYFEQDKPITATDLPANWSLWRESKAGKVYYYLAIKEQ